MIVHSLSGQDCSTVQSVSLEDQELTGFRETRIHLIVDGSALNDLSNPNQSVCRVNLHFKHKNVGDLDIKLYSPAGQFVSLTGPAPFTQGIGASIEWDVSFLPSTDTAVPDAGIDPVWSNSSPWQFLQTYVGSYYPFDGDLLDYNTGPLNGTWTLVIDDVLRFNDGEILAFSIDFCDNTNIDCNQCLAEGGTLSNAEPLDACAFSSQLQLNLSPQNATNNPDYGYGYIISKNDSIFSSLEPVSPDMRSFEEGSYEVCGISYLAESELDLRTELSRLVINPDLSFSEFKRQIETESPLFCAAFSRQCKLISIQTPLDTIRIDTTICNGNVFQFKNQSFTREDDYFVSFGPTGCDSLAIINLTLVDLEARIQASDNMISCTQESIQLSSVGDRPPDTELKWETIGGSFTEASTTTFSDVRVNGVGTYILILTRITDGCSDTTSIEILGDNDIARLNFSSSNRLTCDNPVADISFTSSMPLTDIRWIGPAGFEEFQTNMVNVNEGGQYTVEFTADNGCSSSASFNLIQESRIPDFKFDVDTITCLNPTVGITFADTVAPLTVAWTGPGGYTSGTLSPQNIFVPGIYTLTALAANGCEGVLDFEVIDQSGNLPLNFPHGNIDCDSNETPLIVESVVGITSYSWTGPNGFTSNEAQPLVSIIGTYTVSVTGSNGCDGTATTELLLDTIPPNVSATGTMIGCDGTGSAMVRAITDEANPIFEWSGGVVIPSDQEEGRVFGSGTFIVKVTGDNGCTATADFTVVRDDRIPRPSIIPADTLNCNIDTIQIGFSDQFGYEYMWETPEGIARTSKVIDVSTPGLYRATVTDPANGCILTRNINIPVDTVPIVLEFGDIDVLTCDNIAVRIPTLKMDSATQVSWIGPNNFQSDSIAPFVLREGIYTASIRGNNGCPGTQQYEVIGDLELPLINAADLVIDNCAATTVHSASAIPNTSLIEWEGPFGFQDRGTSIDLSDVGMYKVRATSLNGCSDSTFINVSFTDQENAYDLSFSDSLRCDGQGSRIIGMPVNFPSADFVWTGPFSFRDTGAEITVLNEGTYYTSISLPNSCIVVDSIFIPVVTDIPDFNFDIDTANCFQTIFDVNLSNIDPSLFDISWTGPNGFANTTQQFTTTQEGTYFVEVNSTGNCVRRDSVVLIQIDNTPIRRIFMPEILTCDNDQSQIILQTLSNLDEVSWTGPDGFVSQSRAPIVSIPGIYQVTVQGQNTCIETQDIEIIQNTDAPEINLIGDTLTCNVVNTLILQAETNQSNPQFIWSGPNNYSSTDQFPIVINPGDYFVTVTGDNGCSGMAMTQVITDFEPPEVVIPEQNFGCGLSSFEVQIITDDPGVNIIWNTPTGDVLVGQNPTVRDTGLYFLNIAGSNGCTGRDSIRFGITTERPSISNLADTIINCKGRNLQLRPTLSKPLGLARWSSDNGYTADSLFAVVTEPGEYYLRAQALDGCEAFDTVSIGIDTLAPRVMISFTDRLNCEDTISTIDATGSSVGPQFSYFWRTLGATGAVIDGANEFLPTIAGRGMYALEVTDSINGCSTINSFFIETDLDSFQGVFFDLVDESCPGENNGSIQIDSLIEGEFPIELSLDGVIFSSGSELQNLPPGSYDLIVKDENGCLNDTSFVIAAAKEISFNIEERYEVGEARTVTIASEISDSTDVGSVLWFFNGELVQEGGLSYDIVGERDGILEVEFSSSRGCMIFDEAVVFVFETEHIYLPNAFAPESQNNAIYRIFTDQTIQLINQMIITDAWGNQVYNESNIDPQSDFGWNGIFKGQFAEPGVYLVAVQLTYATGKIETISSHVSLIR